MLHSLGEMKETFSIYNKCEPQARSNPQVVAIITIVVNWEKNSRLVYLKSELLIDAAHV